MAFQRDEATFPPPADVRKMHMFTVVGKQVKINKPSRRAWGKAFGRNVENTALSPNPRNGQAPNVTNCTIVFNLKFEAA
jgi:hypothetical protein